MKSNSAIFSLVLALSLLSLLSSCKKDDPAALNDYFPLTVGAQYKYNYCASYAYVNENSIKTGEITWTFIRKSVETPAVYDVVQTFHRYYNQTKLNFVTHLVNL